MQLVELHATYAARGLRILGFPCNQFGKQVCYVLPSSPTPPILGRNISPEKWRIVLFLNYFALSVIALENLPHSLNKS